MAVECARARRYLLDEGIRAEVIDPVSLSPLDIETIAASVARTGRLIVADCAWTGCGAAAEIITQTLERLQGIRDVRVGRIGFQPVPCPTTKNLENLFYPDARSIAAAAHGVVRSNAARWVPSGVDAPEVMEFRGPF
jgi:pyruvate/2-oxoglutarate/acetoin dehydrogenase E1 component